jgi:hypothetical protein
MWFIAFSLLAFFFHVHFSEVFHQQAVDEDISATDAAQEDQVNAVVAFSKDKGIHWEIIPENLIILSTNSLSAPRAMFFVAESVWR